MHPLLGCGPKAFVTSGLPSARYFPRGRESGLVAGKRRDSSWRQGHLLSHRTNLRLPSDHFRSPCYFLSRPRRL
ncbi:unnamed protein product [Nezara viridula]|uniref:Uncharacterized protein n=1 Tax=Nezara viridula TaxID=85310 RepID=A0A9P0MWQ2_NEZVI|nr:unnamed protein product [Nezara viridula]